MKIGNYLIVLISACVVSSQSFAAGLLTPKASALEALELSEQHVEVVLENGFATTTVEQIFNNPHAQDLEAIYSFPVPVNGAMSEFSVWIDGKEVVGEVLEKKLAKKIYQQEKAAGNNVGLTEQKSFKTFETSVYPIRQGSQTKIKLRYYQIANVDLGVGRWVYQLEDGGVDQEALSFWSTNSNVTKAFSLNFKLRSSEPIEAVRVPSHSQASIVKASENEWHVSLVKRGSASANVEPNQDDVSQALVATYAKAHPAQNSEALAHTQSAQGAAFNLNKDFVVYWKMQEGLPASIDLVAYRSTETQRGTFMMTFTPGDDLKPITQGADWNFVLDLSGSMRGKYHSLVEGVNRSLSKMRAQDRFRIILFNDQAIELTSGYEAATPENVKYYIDKLSKTEPNGGTNLFAGIKAGIQSLDSDRSSGVILVTDGVANIGATKQAAFFKLLEKVDVRLFTFIMGNSANQPLLEPLARHSGGFALNVSNSEDIIGRVIQATEKLTHEAFSDVEVKISGVKVNDLTPSKIGSLYKGQQLVLLGHYRQGGEATVEFSAKQSGQPVSYKTKVNFPLQDQANPELERLWAFAKIQSLQTRMQDFANEDHQQAITDIALEYSLVTDYTSMLVLSEAQFQAHNIERKNAHRTTRENTARQQRAAQPITSNRADKNQPAFKSKRPSRGGGSWSAWWLIFIAALVGVRAKVVQ
ncbi:VIT and vWA domain-containing protein [Aliikangiella sp. IMCC44653]